MRLQIADHDRELAARELDARLLRGTLEAELTTTSKTEGEKKAKADPRYIEFEQQTILIAHARNAKLADAEATRLEILSTIYANEIAGTI